MQLDEIRTRLRARERVTWLWLALDPRSKLIPGYCHINFGDTGKWGRTGPFRLESHAVAWPNGREWLTSGEAFNYVRPNKA